MLRSTVSFMRSAVGGFLVGQTDPALCITEKENSIFSTIIYITPKFPAMGPCTCWVVSHLSYIALLPTHQILKAFIELKDDT